MDLRRLRRRPIRFFAALVALLAAVALVPSLGAAAGAPTDPTPVQLKLMEFNIEYGGFHVSWDSTLEVLERSGADVVAIEEGYGRVDALARDGGWPYYSERFQLLSRYPIIDPEHPPALEPIRALPDPPRRDARADPRARARAAPPDDGADARGVGTTRRRRDPGVPHG
jgi:hypothetical protein